jgi:hypothetical protein
MFKIRVFKATEDPSSTEKYFMGHRNVLKSYGVDEIIAPDTSWFSNPNVYVIIVESIDGSKVYGGAKIQIKVPNEMLPMENALVKIKPEICALVNEQSDNGTAEFCGLWNSREVAGWGIGSIFLVRVGVARAGIAISEKLKINSLFALCASYTLPIAIKTGFKQHTALDNGQGFPYPTNEFRAYIALLEDTSTLKNALIEEREQIFDLRSHPHQTRTEKGPKGETEILYDLTF